MVKSLQLGLATIYIRKEKGNCYVKDEKGESRPIQYAVYADNYYQLPLKDYMILKGIDLVEASKIMKEIGAVLLGPSFQINFYDLDAVNRFIELSSDGN